VTTSQPKVHTQLGRAAVQIFAANDRMNQILIEHLDPAAWRAKPWNPTLQRTRATRLCDLINTKIKDDNTKIKGDGQECPSYT
jgi:hypothetical protein